MLVQEDEELDLSDIDNLPPEVIDQIQMKARERAALNREHAEKAIRARNGLFCNMYWSLADFANSTSDASRIFMRLYAVSDFNQQRMVKQKMATIFRADFHWALTSYNADPSQGIFGGEDHVMRTLEETKKLIMLIKSSLLTTKKARKAGVKSGKNRGKKPAAGGNKA